MAKTIIIIFIGTVLATGLTGLRAQISDRQLNKLSDAPNDTLLRQSDSAIFFASYEAALKQWKTISDVNNWIKGNFRYDIERAKQLAENSSLREKTGIYSPAELYQTPKGVCIDLSRFAVETINLIDTAKHLQYLMIEFEPIIIDGMSIKKHWAAIYHDTTGYYILADSKRPGHIAGPYENVEDFITEYQTFRDRRIIAYKVLLSYQKKKKGEPIKMPKNM